MPNYCTAKSPVMIILFGSSAFVPIVQSPPVHCYPHEIKFTIHININLGSPYPPEITLNALFKELLEKLNCQLCLVE